MAGHWLFLPGMAVGLGLIAMSWVLMSPLLPREIPLARPTDLLRGLDAGGLPTLRVAPAPMPRLLRDPRPLPPGATGLPLTEVGWASATSGWQSSPTSRVPVVDASVAGGPMVVTGTAFRYGIGTYPFSEIVYDLRRNGLSFGGRAGITDDSRDRAGSVRFFVYGDEFLLYESGVVRAGEAAQSIVLDVRGFSQLRLVVDDAGDGSFGDYALWAEPILFTTTALDLAIPEAIRRARSLQAGAERATRAVEYRAIRERRALDGGALERVGSSTHGVTGGFDAQTSQLVLANDRIAVLLGYGGPRNGLLTLIRRADDLPILQDVSPTVEATDRRRLPLPTQRPGDVSQLQFERTNRPGHGQAVEAVATFLAGSGEGKVAIHITLLDAVSAFELKVTTEGIPLKSVQYLDSDAGVAFLGRNIYYRAASSPVSEGRVRADGHVRRVAISAAEPALLWSEATRQGLLFSFPEPRPSPVLLSARRQPGRSGTDIGIELSELGTSPNVSPALSVTLVDAKPGQ